MVDDAGPTPMVELLAKRGNVARARRVTITEIAKSCGVSAQTVSRVINNRPDVSPETREAIERAIETTGYQPSALARGLVRQRSQMLGVVVGRLGHIGVSQLLNGIVDQSQAAGYGLLLREINDQATSSLEPVMDMLISHQVEGIIFAAPATDWTVGLETEVPPNCPPVIFLKRAPSPHHTTIAVDNEAAAAMVVDHLLSLGRTRIAHISGPAQWLEARQRRHGWAERMRAAGLSTDRVDEGDWTSASGEAACKRLFDRFDDIDAVFASNDHMALGVLREANRRGLRVPDDVAIVGFDGIIEGEFTTPSLTSMTQPLSKIGATAVQRLLREIDGDVDAPPGAVLLLPTELVVRESAPYA